VGRRLSRRPGRHLESTKTVVRGKEVEESKNRRYAWRRGRIGRSKGFSVSAGRGRKLSARKVWEGKWKKVPEGRLKKKGIKKPEMQKAV